MLVFTEGWIEMNDGVFGREESVLAGCGDGECLLDVSEGWFGTERGINVVVF